MGSLGWALALPAPVEDLIGSLPPLVSPTGVMVYGIGSVLLLIGLANAITWYRERQAEDVALADLLDEETLDSAGREEPLFEDIAERQQSVMAPAAIEWETRTARVGEDWTTTLYVAGYPDYPSDGYLSGLFELTEVRFDLTVSITPKHQGRARDALQRTADDIQADADLERSVRGAYLQERAAEATATYKAVENGQRVFDQGMFVTVRADTKDGEPGAEDGDLYAGPRVAVGGAGRPGRV